MALSYRRTPSSRCRAGLGTAPPRPTALPQCPGIGPPVGFGAQGPISEGLGRPKEKLRGKCASLTRRSTEKHAKYTFPGKEILAPGLILLPKLQVVGYKKGVVG